jgi:hypothetical protein
MRLNSNKENCKESGMKKIIIKRNSIHVYKRVKHIGNS